MAQVERRTSFIHSMLLSQTPKASRSCLCGRDCHCTVQAGTQSRCGVSLGHFEIAGHLNAPAEEPVRNPARANRPTPFRYEFGQVATGIAGERSQSGSVRQR